MSKTYKPGDTVWYLWHGSMTHQGEIAESWEEDGTTWYRMLNGMHVVSQENIDIVRQDDE